jgi:hypothetical protein
MERFRISSGPIRSDSTGLFYNIDFTTGTTDKITKIKEGNVFAFRTVENVIGIAKFSQIAAANDGSMKVQLITKKF